MPAKITLPATFKMHRAVACLQRAWKNKQRKRKREFILCHENMRKKLKATLKELEEVKEHVYELTEKLNVYRFGVIGECFVCHDRQVEYMFIDYLREGACGHGMCEKCWFEYWKRSCEKHFGELVRPTCPVCGQGSRIDRALKLTRKNLAKMVALHH